MSLLSFPCGCCSSRKFYPGCTRAGRLKPVYVHFLVLHNHNTDCHGPPPPSPSLLKNTGLFEHMESSFSQRLRAYCSCRGSALTTHLFLLFSQCPVCFSLPQEWYWAVTIQTKSFSSRVSTVSKRNHDLCLSSPKQDLWGIDFSIESSGSAVS